MNDFLLLGLKMFLNSLSYVAPDKAGQLALNLFCSPQEGRLTPHQKEFLNKAEPEVLELQGMPIQCYRWPGPGRAVLLVHGWESNAARWQQFISLLKERDFHIIALDAPAHGQSGGKYFNAILYAQMIGVVVDRFHPEVLVGHSAGGFALSYYLTHIPATWAIDQLTLLGVPVNLRHMTDYFSRFLGLSPRVQNEVEKVFLQQFGNPIDYYNIPNFVSHLKIPGLVVHDRKDHIAPYAGALEIHHKWKGSQMITTQGLGHSMHDENLYRQIMSFF